MNNIHEYYDNMADISVLTEEIIVTLKVLVEENVRLALAKISNARKYGGDTPISPVSNCTVNDVHRSLLFLELLLNQTQGVTNTLVFKELLGLTSYLTSEEEEF